MIDSTDLSTLEGKINPTTGAAPSRRFISKRDPNDGTWLNEQIRTFRMVGDIKDIERSQIEAMLRFAPPYSDSQLRALNMESVPNSTLGELPRRVNQDEGVWTDFITSSAGLWQIKFPSLPGQISSDIEERCSELLNECWADEVTNVVAMQVAFRQFATYGIGPMVWVDPYDPLPIARTASSLRFPKGTRITLENMPEVSLEDTYSPQALYQAIRGEVGEKRAAIHGWNRKEVLEVLKCHSSDSNEIRNRFQSLEELELVEGRGENIWQGYKRTEIRVVHVWVQEYEPDDAGNQYSYLLLCDTGKAWRIIREKPYCYKEASDFMVLATDHVGSDGTIDGIRGMAVNMREHARSMDILHNAGMMASFQSSIPVYASTGATSGSAAEQIQIRPNSVILPSGFQQVQNYVDASAATGMVNWLSNHADGMQGVYTVNAPNKGGVQRTAAEANADLAKESELKSSQILPIVRLFFEPLGQTFAKRLWFFPKADGQILRFPGWKVAEKFWRRLSAILAEYQLPLALLADNRISINPANTPGGLDKKLMRVKEAMQFYPLLQTATQRNALTNWGLTSIFGHQVAKPLHNQNEPQQDSGFREKIDSENADMLSGRQRLVLPEQDHLSHLGPIDPNGVGHIPFVIQTMQAIQQGLFDKFTLDPLDALAEQLRAGVTIIGHIDAHLALLAENPILMDAPEIQNYFDFSAQMQQQILQTIKMFEKEAADRQEQGGEDMDPKTKAMLMKAQTDIQIAQAKAANEMQIAQQKNFYKLGNMAQTNEARRDEKLAMAILDGSIKSKNSAADIRRKLLDQTLDFQRGASQIEMSKAASKMKNGKAKPASKPMGEEEDEEDEDEDEGEGEGEGNGNGEGKMKGKHMEEMRKMIEETIAKNMKDRD